MKYFSEDIVREMVKEAEAIAFVRSCGVKTAPLDIADYPSIEIPDKHGALIDRDKLMATMFIECASKAGIINQIDLAPVILEAST